MNKTVQNCTHCGSNLTPQDLMGVNCRYCGTALPHQVAAAQQASLVNQMLANPQTMQNMANMGAQYQHQFNQQQYGGQQQYPGQPGAPPQGPYGAPNPYGMPPGGYYGAPQVQQAMAQAHRSVAIWIVISVVIMLVVTGGIFAMTFSMR